MFSILERIAGLFLDATKAYQEYQNSKRRKIFALRLTTAYLRLLEVIATGENIIKGLQLFITIWEIPEKRDDWRYRKSDLINALQKQVMNLNRFQQALSAVVAEMEILSPGSAGDLGRIVRLKQLVVLNSISTLLQNGHLPIKYDVRGTLDIDNSGKRLWETDVDTLRFSKENTWDEKVYDKLKSYLGPRARSDEITKLKQHARLIRKLIVDNYELDEILWATDYFID